MARRCVDYLDDTDYLNFSSFQRWCTSHASPPRYSYPSFYSDAMCSVHSNKFDVYNGGYYKTPYWLLQHLAASGNESFYLSKRNDKRYHNSWYNPDGFHYKENRYYQHRKLDENYKIDRGNTYDHMTYDERRCFTRCNRNGSICRNKQRNEENLSSRPARNPDVTGNICDGNTDPNSLNSLHDSRMLSLELPKKKDDEKQNNQNSHSTISDDKSKPSEDEEKDSTNNLNSHVSENTTKTSSPKYNNGYASWYMSEEQQQIVDTLREVNMRHERQLRRDIQAAKEGRPRSDDSSSSYNEMNISDTQHRSSSSDEDECITLLLSSADVAPICDPLNEEDVEVIRNDYLEKSSSDYFEDFQSIFTVSPEKKIINTLTKVCMKEEFSTDSQRFEDIHSNKLIAKDVIKLNVECIDENSTKPFTKVNNEDVVVKSLHNEVSEDTDAEKLNECKNEETLGSISFSHSYSRSSSPYIDVLKEYKDDAKIEDARNIKTKDSCKESLSNSYHSLLEKKSTPLDDPLEVTDSCINNNLDDEKFQNKLIERADVSEKEHKLSKENFQLSSQISEFPGQSIFYIRNEDEKAKETEIKDFNDSITPTDIETSSSVQTAVNDTCNFKCKELPNDCRNERKEIKSPKMGNYGMHSEILNTSSLNIVKNSYERNENPDYHMFGHSSKIDASYIIQSQDNQSRKSDSCLINPKVNHKCTFQRTGMCSVSDPFMSNAQNVQAYKRISVEDIFQIQTNVEKSDALKKLFHDPVLANSSKTSSKSSVSYISPTTHLKMLLGIGKPSSLPASNHQEITENGKTIFSQDYQSTLLSKTSTSNRFETSFLHSKGDGNYKQSMTQNLKEHSDQTPIQNVSESSNSFLPDPCKLQKDYKIQKVPHKEGKNPSVRNGSHITRNYYTNENLNHRNRRLTTKAYYYNNISDKSDKMKNQRKNFTAASKEELNVKSKIYTEKKSFEGSYYPKSNEKVKTFPQDEAPENQRKQRKKRSKKEKGVANNRYSYKKNVEFPKAKHEANCKEKSVEIALNVLERGKDVTQEKHTKNTISDSSKSKHSSSRRSAAFLNNSATRSLISSKVENVNISAHCIRSREFQSLDSNKIKQNELVETNKQQNRTSPEINKEKNPNTEKIDEISNVRGNFCYPSLQSKELKPNRKADIPSPEPRTQTDESKTCLKSNSVSLHKETISLERPNNLGHVSRHDFGISKYNIRVSVHTEDKNEVKAFDNSKKQEVITREESERPSKPSKYKPESLNKSSELKTMNSVIKQQLEKYITVEKMRKNNNISSLLYNIDNPCQTLRVNSRTLDIDAINLRACCMSIVGCKENKKKNNVSKFTTGNSGNSYNVNNQILSLNIKSQNKDLRKEDRFLQLGKYDDKVAFNRNLFHTYSIRNLRDASFAKLDFNSARVFIPKLTIFPLIMKEFFLAERYLYDANDANILANEPVSPTNFAGKHYFDKKIFQHLIRAQKKTKGTLIPKSSCEKTSLQLDSDRCLKCIEDTELLRCNSSVINYSKNETLLLCTLCYNLATSILKSKSCPRIFIVESDTVDASDFLKLQGDILCKLLPCEKHTSNHPHKSNFLESHVLHISPLSLKTLSALATNQRHLSHENASKVSTDYIRNKSMCASKDHISDICLISKLGEKMEERHGSLDISQISAVNPRCISSMK